MKMTNGQLSFDGSEHKVESKPKPEQPSGPIKAEHEVFNLVMDPKHGLVFTGKPQRVQYNFGEQPSLVDENRKPTEF